LAGTFSATSTSRDCGWSTDCRMDCTPDGPSHGKLLCHHRRASKPLPPTTAHSIPRQIYHRPEKGEFPTIRGAPGLLTPLSSTPTFRAPGKQQQTRLPGKVKALRASDEKEGEYPSSAGSPGPHVKVATPLPSQCATYSRANQVHSFTFPSSAAGTCRWPAWAYLYPCSLTISGFQPNRAYVPQSPRL